MSSMCPTHHCSQLLSGQALGLDNAGSPSTVQSNTGLCCQRVSAALPHQVVLPHVLTVPLGSQIAKPLAPLAHHTAVNSGHCVKWWQWDRCSQRKTGSP